MTLAFQSAQDSYFLYRAILLCLHYIGSGALQRNYLV